MVFFFLRSYFTQKQGDKEAVNRNIQGHKPDGQMIREVVMRTKPDQSHELMRC